MSSDDWPIENVMQCLENMGICISLSLRPVHRYKAGGEVSESDKRFIDQHYSAILRHLIRKAYEREVR
jgi:hypothetical protein